MPKKDQQGYYGFDSSGLEKAAAVRTFEYLRCVGC